MKPHNPRAPVKDQGSRFSRGTKMDSDERGSMLPLAILSPVNRSLALL